MFDYHFLNNDMSVTVLNRYLKCGICRPIAEIYTEACLSYGLVFMKHIEIPPKKHNRSYI